MYTFPSFFSIQKRNKLLHQHGERRLYRINENPSLKSFVNKEIKKKVKYFLLKIPRFSEVITLKVLTE